MLTHLITFRGALGLSSLLTLACSSTASLAPVADAATALDTAAVLAPEAAVIDAAAVTPDVPAADVPPPPPEDLDMAATDFACLTTGTKVRRFFLWNRLGHLDEALAVANSPTGGAYPVGTVLQIIPFEAMVKRKAGFNPTLGDWEFFSLNVAKEGTTIVSRGTTDVQNQFGGKCAECHLPATAKWDFVCETTHGCKPIGASPELIEAFQNGDPRCP